MNPTSPKPSDYVIHPTLYRVDFDPWVDHNDDRECFVVTRPVRAVFPRCSFREVKTEDYDILGDRIDVFPGFEFDPSGPTIDDRPTVLASLYHDIACGAKALPYFRRHWLLARIMWVQRKRYAHTKGARRVAVWGYTAWHLARCAGWFAGLLAFNWLPVEWGKVDE